MRRFHRRIDESRAGFVAWTGLVVAALWSCQPEELGGSSTDRCDIDVDAEVAGSDVAFRPRPRTSWQWQLSGLPIDMSFDVSVYDVDLFTTSEAEISALHAAGRKVICYFSAGSFEAGRPDSDAFPQAVKGAPLDAPFEDELWLDIRSGDVRSIMSRRLDIAATKTCDAVEPDNVDGFANEPGFAITASDQIDFNLFIAREAHARGLSVGLKNDLDQIPCLLESFDWALNEECFSFDECSVYADTFIAANKAVFHAEYVGADRLSDMCAVTQPIGLSSLIKHIELDAFQLACP